MAASATVAERVIVPFGVALDVEAVAVVVEADPAGSTWIAPIMPASSCWRMWQW